MVNVLSAERREGGVELATNGGRLVVNEIEHRWIKTSDKNATRASIIATSGLPQPLITVSASGLGICKNVSAERSPENPTLWNVTITYSSEVTSDGSGVPGSDPTAWVPRRETFLEPFEEVQLRDLDGVPYVNGAGVPFATAPSVPKDNIRWDFYQLEPLTVTDEHIAERNNSTNLTNFLNYIPHTLLLKVRKSIVGTYYGVDLRLSEYSLIFKESNWMEKIGNWGNTFKYNGNIYPYKYRSDKEPRPIHYGPLGNKDYPWGTTMDARGGEPTGGNGAGGPGDAVEVADGTVYAKPSTMLVTLPPPNPNAAFAAPVTVTLNCPRLYFLERRRFRTLNFNSILRVI